MCEADDEYNGWKNRETWALNLHLTNDERWNVEALDLARAADTPTRLADDLRSWVDDIWAGTLHGLLPLAEYRAMISDVGSRWRIDYEEVARAFLATSADIDGDDVAR